MKAKEIQKRERKVFKKIDRHEKKNENRTKIKSKIEKK